MDTFENATPAQEQLENCEVRIDRSAIETVTLFYGLTFEGNLTTEQRHLLSEAAARCPVTRTLSGRIAVMAAK